MPSGKFSQVSIGETIGCLEVIEVLPVTGNPRVRCACHACGSSHYTNSYSELRRNQRRAQTKGRDVTCGCGTRAALSEAKRNPCAKSHKKSYHVWRMMLKRCNDPTYQAYPNYGARGIQVCERWHVYANFVADMGEPPDKHDLERKDNMRGYSPENCGWRTRRRNANNKRNNRHININGVQYTVSQAARKFDVPPSTALYRATRGSDVAYKGNYSKLVRGKFYTDGVRTLCIADWGKLWCVPHTTARAKVKRMLQTGELQNAKPTL